MRRLLSFLAICAACAAQAQMANSPLQMPSPLPAVPGPVVGTPVTTPVVPAASTAPAVAAASGVLNGYVPDDTYKLRAGDTVSFQIVEDQVWDPANAPKILVVQDSGEIETPYIGRVMAVGKTCKQLAGEIKSALEKDYYKQATVVISVNAASPILGRVYIWGQVHNQGALDVRVNENLTAGQAIMRAGGFADFANEKKVKVIRASAGTNTVQSAQTFNLDMTQILDKGKTENDVVLQPGDLVIVPSRLINF